MCDVCSTSLFNAHFTCTTCGLIVCLDCLNVRSKGNLAYGSSNSSPHTYKSRKRLIRNDLDKHYWPFCHEGDEHEPSKLLLTQIICGDILQTITDNVHDIKRKLGFKLDCNCCKDKIQEVPPSLKGRKKAAMNAKNAVKIDELNTKHRDESLKMPEKQQLQRDQNETSPVAKSPLADMTACPVCKEPSKDKDTLYMGLHLRKHFEVELRKVIGIDKPPYTCQQCPNFKSDDLDETMLHFGIVHNEFLRLVNKRRKQERSIRDIALKVDKEKQ